MFYTISGAVIGGISCYAIAKVFNIEFEKKAGLIKLPGPGEFLVIGGIIFGAGMGFGYAVKLS
jgi:hypothetical protein